MVHLLSDVRVGHVFSRARIVSANSSLTIVEIVRLRWTFHESLAEHTEDGMKASASGATTAVRLVDLIPVNSMLPRNLGDTDGSLQNEVFEILHSSCPHTPNGFSDEGS